MRLARRPPRASGWCSACGFILIISKPCLAFSGRGPTQTGPSLLVLFGRSDLVSTYTRAGSQVAPSAKGSRAFLDINEAELDSQPPSALVEFESGSYRLISLVVLRELPAAEPGRKRFQRLAVAYPPENAPGRSGFYADITIELPPKYWQKINTDLKAAVGRPTSGRSRCRTSLSGPSQSPQGCRPRLRTNRLQRPRRSKAADDAMEFVESLTSGLPPSRDDEPPACARTLSMSWPITWRVACNVNCCEAEIRRLLALAARSIRRPGGRAAGSGSMR